MIKRIKLLALLLFLFPPLCHAVQENNSGEEDKIQEKESSPSVGNFSLPYSQQPGPLLGFGERVIEKGQKQVFLFVDYFKGVNKYASDLVPTFLYAFADKASVSLNVPIAATFKEEGARSSGFEDMFLQVEYAFYQDQTSCFSEQATLVGDISFPTGSSKKIPLQVLGLPAFS